MNNETHKDLTIRARLINKFLNAKTALSREAFNKLKYHCLRLVRERKIVYFSNLNVKNIINNSVL